MPSVHRIALGLALLLAAAPALGQPLRDDPRAHFARGVALYADGNYEAALVEFQASYAQRPNANLLYNLGATLESLGRFVEARDALLGYRARGTPAVVASREAEITERLARLRERIGTLRVVVDLPGLSLGVDGVEVSIEQARTGVELSAGMRLVRLHAPGFVAREERRAITGGQTVTLDAPLERERASLALSADVDHASVYVDDVAAGTLPLAAPLRLEVGRHEVRVERPGYGPWRRVVDLDATGLRLEATLPWASPVPPEVASRVSLRTNVAFPEVTVDGRAVTLDGRAALPPGQHTLRVGRAGYEPATREVDLPSGAHSVSVWLAPSAALRASDEARQRSWRRIGGVVLGAGAIVAAVGVPLAVVARGDFDQAEADVTAAQGLLTYCSTQMGVGDPRCITTSTRDLTAEQERARAAQQVAQRQFGVGLGLAIAGAAAMVAGVVVLAVAPTPRARRAPPDWALRVGPGALSFEGVF